MITRICALLFAVLCVFALLPATAQADTLVSWIRIVDDNVGLYANCDSSKIIFYLPKSYYLQVLGEEKGMYLVCLMQNQEGFPQITGYVWKSEVDDCDEPPLAPYYPTERLVVNTDSAQIKLSPTPSAETLLTVTNTQRMSYYGEIQSYGDTWYYVYFCGKFGYVSANCVTKPVIALHPTPLYQPVIVPTPPQDDPQEDPTTQEQHSSATEIFLIVFVALLAVGISLALFLPGNVKKREVFDREI